MSIQLSYALFAIAINFSIFCDAYAVYIQYIGLSQKSGTYSFLLNVIVKAFLKLYTDKKILKRSVSAKATICPF